MWLIEVVVKIVFCILLVDFVSDFFHWLEDAYGNEEWPIIGELVTKPNILHHYDPRYFTRYSWLYSARILLGMGGIILAVAYALGQLNWWVILFVLIGINANEIHKWAHRAPHENGKLITALQRSGLIQSPRHHGVHHRDPKNSHYCVITDYLNPVLERIGLWNGLEAAIYQLLGVRRRPDHSVKQPMMEASVPYTSL